MTTSFTFITLPLTSKIEELSNWEDPTVDSPSMTEFAATDADEINRLLRLFQGNDAKQIDHAACQLETYLRQNHERLIQTTSCFDEAIKIHNVLLPFFKQK